MLTAAHNRFDELEQQLLRLDARVKSAPGQMGLDFTAPANPTGSTGKGGGQKCGGGWIAPDLTCHKEGGGTEPAQKEGYRPTPQVKAGVEVKPMTLNPGGDSKYDPADEKKKAAGGLKYYRSNRGGVKYNYFFRDRQAAEHWYADDVASSDADIEQGTNRRAKEWQLEYKASYEGTRNVLRDVGDRELLETVQAYAQSGKASGRGVAVDVRIQGNEWSRPVREGTFASTQDIATSKQQAAFARQQQEAAKEAGDERGAQAWKQEERTVERARVQAAIEQKGQSQTALFGVTEYDETMPLFRQRRDAGDEVPELISAILSEQLPGAQLLDWGIHPRGITAGRVASEGFVYRFRLDAESVGYRPAWEGINERQWELRSDGFLAARQPDARLDFQKPKFQQQSTKRKCVKGYGCGSACIQMSKECRVQPKSAISKQRLLALQTLAKEGDPMAEQMARSVQEGRSAKASELREGRQVDQLKRLLADPKVAEMVRTGKVPTAEPTKPGKVRDVDPKEVEVDPERFQYKIGASASGEVGSLSGVQKWDPNLAGVISVWRDPADGKTYVVNGHNRLALAKRLGADEVTVRYLDAKDAKEARAIGAMQNIAEGAGKEIDAAKFFRDTGIATEEEVKAKGLPLNSGKASRGLALSKLPDEMFQDVVQGDLKVGRAAIIGGSGLDQDKQREVYKVLKKNKNMTDGTLQEYVEQLEVSQRMQQEEIDLFGTNTKTVDTGLSRAELVNSLKGALGREARLLGAVSKSQKAVQVLEEKGGNVINVEQSQKQAQEAGSVLRTFDQLKNVSGPVKTALDQAAARVTAGENKAKVAAELREAVIQALEEELKALGLRKPTSNEAESMSMFDSADPIAAIERRLDYRAKQIEQWAQEMSGLRGSGGKMPTKGQLIRAEREAVMGKGKLGGGKGAPCGKGYISSRFKCEKDASEDFEPGQEKPTKSTGFKRAAAEAGRAIARALTQESKADSVDALVDRVAALGAFL